MAARDLVDRYRLLLDVDVETKMTGLAMEFEKVEKTIYHKLHRNTASLDFNMPKNRYGAIPCELPILGA